MTADYYPFGMQMPGRGSSQPSYRYGYNGMEKDDETKGMSGSSYTTEFRQYDPRLGRWLSLDPLMMQFPWMSPYVAFDDNPVFYTDPYGLAPGNGDDGIGEDEEGIPQIVDLSQVSKGGEDKGRRPTIKRDNYTDMKEVKGKGGKTLTIPAGARTEYNSSGELEKFSYQYTFEGSTVKRDFVARPSESGTTTIYSDYGDLLGDEDEVELNYYSGGFYENETDAYKAMWETTQNKDGTWFNSERIAYITEKGVWVSSNAFSGQGFSNHTIKTVVKDDKLYINGERVLAALHTHPGLANVGQGGFSGADQNNTVLLGGAFQIIIEFNNNVGVIRYENGANKFYPVPSSMTRESLVNGSSKLIPTLKALIK